MEGKRGIWEKLGRFMGEGGGRMVKRDGRRKREGEGEMGCREGERDKEKGK